MSRFMLTHKHHGGVICDSKILNFARLFTFCHNIMHLILSSSHLFVFRLKCSVKNLLVTVWSYKTCHVYTYIYTLNILKNILCVMENSVYVHK